MISIYESMNKLVDRKESFVLATILEKSGSAPREEGAKMIIRKDFSIIGTIGGGLIEALTIKLSAAIFKSEEFKIESFNLSNEGAASLGMVCGGDVKILLEFVDCSDKEMTDIYKKMIELNNSNSDFILITKISKDNRKTGLDKWICTETGFYGEENERILFVSRKIREDFKKTIMENIAVEGESYLIEPFLKYEKVYIIGAGHVAQKIVDLTKMLSFNTIVLDDREEFANRKRFETADEVKAIPSFDNLLNYIKVDNRSYVIIVTRGHAYDKEVLAQVLKTDAKYIGMIGSKNKRNFIYNSLLNEGFTRKDLERVYSPIGIPIYADTPEEIAVSIVAELIKIKRGPINEKK